MLEHDPIPWLMAAEGEEAVRARCSLELTREGDSKATRNIAWRLAKSQLPDGSFDHSPMKTAHDPPLRSERITCAGYPQAFAKDQLQTV